MVDVHLFDIHKMKSGFGPNTDAQIIWDSFISYNIMVSNDGRYVEKNTMHHVHRNRLRCMLKYDYKSKGGIHNGVELEKLINKILAAVLVLGVDLYENPDQLLEGVETVKINDEFI